MGIFPVMSFLFSWNQETIKTIKDKIPILEKKKHFIKLIKKDKKNITSIPRITVLFIEDTHVSTNGYFENGI